MCETRVHMYMTHLVLYIHYIHVDTVHVQFNASHHTERTACMCETRVHMYMTHLVLYTLYTCRHCTCTSRTIYTIYM